MILATNLGFKFFRDPNFLGIKFLGVGDQISWGPNFLETKKVRGPNEIRDHFNCSQKKRYLKSWTGLKIFCCCFTVHFFFWLFKYLKSSALDNKKCTKIKAKKGQNFWEGFILVKKTPKSSKVTKFFYTKNL